MTNAQGGIRSGGSVPRLAKGVAAAVCGWAALSAGMLPVLLAEGASAQAPPIRPAGTTQPTTRPAAATRPTATTQPTTRLAATTRPTTMPGQKGLLMNFRNASAQSVTFSRKASGISFRLKLRVSALRTAAASSEERESRIAADCFSRL